VTGYALGFFVVLAVCYKRKLPCKTLMLKSIDLCVRIAIGRTKRDGKKNLLSHDCSIASRSFWLMIMLQPVEANLYWQRSFCTNRWRTDILLCNSAKLKCKTCEVHVEVFTSFTVKAPTSLSNHTYIIWLILYLIFGHPFLSVYIRDPLISLTKGPKIS
jgi:hypothetical protein